MNADVVIVGGGPVGMTMSIACSRLGLSNVVIEREPEAFPLPRAIEMDAEVHRSLLRHDLGESLQRCLSPMVAADFVDSSGAQLMGIELSPRARISGDVCARFSGAACARFSGAACAAKGPHC